MDPKENEVLKLSFANKKLDDFYLYHIDLEENLSFDFKATCVAFSEKPHNIDELKETLGINANIQIIQPYDNNTKKRTRYLSGIVTSIEHLGLFVRTEKSEVFAYKFVVEPQVAVFKNVIKSQSFNNTNIYDTINTISDQYGLGFILDEHYIMKDDYISKCNYNQNEISVYQFLKEIFGMYGLSLCYTHSKDATKTFVTNGNKIPVASVIDYSNGKDDVETPFNFDLSLKKEDNFYYMKNWSMNSSIGIDGLCLLETYPNSNTNGDDWKTKDFDDKKRFLEYNKHFHMYSYGCNKGDVDKDVKLILNAYQRRNDIKKDYWYGTSDNIILMPGRLMKLYHAYSNKDNNVVFALIKKSHLNVFARYPNEIITMLDDGASNKYDVNIEVMDYNVEKRYVG